LGGGWVPTRGLYEETSLLMKTNPDASASRTGATSASSVLRSRLRRRDEITAWAFLAPGLIAFTVFVVVPALGAIVLSFFDWRLFDNPSFVGLKHLRKLFGDANMWKSLGVTVIFVLVGVIPTTLIGFLLAVVASSSLRGTAALRVLFFSPMVASSAITAVLWTNLYRVRDGFINQMLAQFGIEGPNWMTDPGIARPALIVVMIWSALPVVIILYIAAIQKVPEDIYAAASLDGAGRWRQLWSMTWPNVMSTTIVLLVLMFTTFLGAPLEFALLMTDGGPLGETTTLGLYAFKVAFERRDMGYASALALWQLVLVGTAFLAGRGITALWRKRR